MLHVQPEPDIAGAGPGVPADVVHRFGHDPERGHLDRGGQLGQRAGVEGDARPAAFSLTALSPLATAGVSSVLTNALPIAAGIVVFGEEVSAARMVAFAFVVSGAALLVRPQAGVTQAEQAEQAA